MYDLRPFLSTVLERVHAHAVPGQLGAYSRWAWADAEGKTWITYNDPKYFEDRHHVPAELVRNISVAVVLAEEAAV